MPSPIPGRENPSPRAEGALDFELLFRSAPSLLLVLDPGPGFRILAASDAYLRATRSSRDAILSRPYFDVFPEKADGERVTGSTTLRAALERVVETRTADALNSPVLTAAGELRYIIHRVDAIELEVLRSAHERDEAMRQLNRANEELQAFVYSASHDLRAPLHAIDGFCRLFEQIHGPSLGDPTRRLLNRIESNVNRMETIIEGLLSLSRIGRSHMVRKRVDLTALARRVVHDLGPREAGRKVELDIAEGLEAWADERMILVALENLLGNAWKYTAHRVEARIEVGRRRVVGKDVFYVRDNGAGFDMAYADKLFSPFVRLHNASEFEGHGIGLATVKRIIERHGGEIWAEAQPEKGATIHFTLGRAAG